MSHPTILFVEASNQYYRDATVNIVRESVGARSIEQATHCVDVFSHAQTIVTPSLTTAPAPAATTTTATDAASAADCKVLPKV